MFKRDRHRIFRYTWLQSDLGREIQIKHGLDAKDQSSVVLKIGQKVYIKSDAVLEILKRLPGIWHYLFFLKFVPKSIRDGLYDLIAKNRYRWFGHQQSCPIPSNKLKERFL